MVKHIISSISFDCFTYQEKSIFPLPIYISPPDFYLLEPRTNLNCCRGIRVLPRRISLEISMREMRGDSELYRNPGDEYQ